MKFFAKELSLLNDLFFLKTINSVRSNNLSFNYLQLLNREVKVILLYLGFPRAQMLRAKHPERSEGCLEGKIGQGNDRG